MARTPAQTPAQRVLPLLLVLLLVALAFAGGLVKPPWRWKSYLSATAAVSEWWVGDDPREL
jgi:hypothetical protein